MGAGRAFQLGCVLAGAGQAGRVDRFDDRTTADADAFCQRKRCMVGIDHDCLAGRGKGCDLVVEGGWRLKAGELGEVGFLLDARLALVEEQFGRAVCMDNGAGEGVACVARRCRGY